MENKRKRKKRGEIRRTEERGRVGYRVGNDREKKSV